MKLQQSRTGAARSRVAIWLAVIAALLPFVVEECHGQSGVLVFTPGVSASTAAGSGKRGYSGDGRSATSATLSQPSSVAYAPNGDLVIADTGNHVIRRVTADGVISTITGTGIQGYSGDGGPAIQASLDSPRGIAAGSDGTLYIADTRNHRVRKVSAAGTITTVAGTGIAGYSGDGSSATAAQLRNPTALAIGLAGEIYIADSGNHRVRRIARDGTITTVAGNGIEGASGDGGPATQAALDDPTGVAVRPDGSLLIADRRNNKVRAVGTNGTISTLAMDGATLLRSAAGVSTDADGMVYVADGSQHMVRQVAQNGSGVLLGSGQGGNFTAGSPLAAEVSSPVAVATDSSGAIAVADSKNQQVYHLSLPRLSFPDTPLGTESTPLSLRLLNAGSTDLRISAISLPVGYAVTESSTCGTAPLTLAPSAGCTLALTFHPTAVGIASGLLTVTANTGLPQRALLTGTGLVSATSLPSSALVQAVSAVAYAGMPIQFNASVVTQFATPPSGTVIYLDGGKEIGSSALTSNGSTQFSTSALGIGLHTISVRYSGDARYAPSTSAAVQQTIVAIPDFTIAAASTALTITRGGSATASLTLQPVNGTLNRNIAIQVNGLPAGTTVNISPSPAALGSDPVRVDIVMKTSATSASVERFGTFAAAGILLLLRRRRVQAGLLLCLLVAVQGCGGGYLSGKNTGPAASTTYNVNVVASTTGMTGDLLLHTTTFTLVLN